MSKISFLSIFLITLVLGCRTRPVYLGEQALLPDPQEAKWWIINTVVKDDQQKDLHVCFLLNAEKAGEDDYASCFFSLWSEAKNSYEFGLQSSGRAKLKSNQHFPTGFSIPGRDSSENEWRWQLTRSGFKLEAAANAKGNATRSLFDLRSTYDKQEPFLGQSMPGSPYSHALNPISSLIQVSGAKRAEARAPVFIRAFSGREVLLNRSTREKVFWLDLSLRSGKRLSLFFGIDREMKTSQISALLWDEKGRVKECPGLSIHPDRNKIFPSRSGKIYPLNFSVMIPEENLSLSIRPRMEDQEVMANRASFWMGAIAAYPAGSEQEAGTGNMYIFSQ
ncbi:MAG: hypothetical protein IPI66_10535 [Chitinophagaceae bacterium]|nr:hypothetical protein [Chitinophagaceae bacterium]